MVKCKNSGKVDNVNEAADKIVEAIDDGKSWSAKSINYVAAYAAVKYLDSHLDSPESSITHIHDKSIGWVEVWGLFFR